MKKKILLIDDSMTIHRVIDLSIDDEKYEVEKVFAVDDAETKLKVFKPDIILLDNKLEGIKLEEYAAKLKRDCGAAVILLVGAFDEFTEKNLKNSNADDYIVKPFNSSLLDEKLSKVASNILEDYDAIDTNQSQEHKDEAVEELLASLETEKPLEENLTSNFDEISFEKDDIELSKENFKESDTDDDLAILEDEKLYEGLEGEKLYATEGDISEDILTDFITEEDKTELSDDAKNEFEVADEKVDIEDIFGELEEADESEVEHRDTFQTESIEDLEEENIGTIEELSEEEQAGQEVVSEIPGDISFEDDTLETEKIATNNTKNFVEDLEFSEKMLEKEMPHKISKEMIREIVYEAVDINFMKDIVRETVSKSLEKAVWEIVPELAEKLILEEIERIKKGQ